MPFPAVLENRLKHKVFCNSRIGGLMRSNTFKSDRLPDSTFHIGFGSHFGIRFFKRLHAGLRSNSLLACFMQRASCACRALRSI